MCACLYSTAEFHYSNYLNRVINLHHCGHVSLPCVPSSGSAVLCCVATAPLPPSHPLVAHTWSVSRTPAVIPMRSAAFEELSTSSLQPSPPHLCTSSGMTGTHRASGKWLLCLFRMCLPSDFYAQLPTVGLRVEWTVVKCERFFIAHRASRTNQKTDALSFICPLHCLHLTQQLKYKFTFSRNHLLMQPWVVLNWFIFHKTVLVTHISYKTICNMSSILRHCGCIFKKPCKNMIKVS